MVAAFIRTFPGALLLFADVAKWVGLLRFGVVNLGTDLEEDMVGQVVLVAI
jgi:hypothetical protein